MGKGSLTYKPGEMIGKYKILDLIGTGGKAAVYLAEQPILRRKVAIKTLIVPNKELSQRLYQEAMLLAELDHPNIATLHDVGEVDGCPYVAMAYTEGRSLRQLVASGEALPILAVLRIIAAVAGALEHAHAKKVVHKDVKPGNILIRPSGEPVLTGFGLAAPAWGDPLVEEGAFYGTPAYVSPEQAQGSGVSRRADVWSLGATMYQLLAGRTPYVDENPLQLLLKIVSPDPVDFSPLEGKAPEYVIAIIERCLRKNPDERCQTAGELRRALEAAIDQLEMSESETLEMKLPQDGQTLLLHVEYQEADLPGAYREYEIGPRMGGGNFGDVFRAKERLSDKTVALKILKREWLANATAVARFRREATLLARLSHPNIVRVYNYGRYGVTFFIAMDLLEGRTLRSVADKRGQMDAGEAVSYVLPVLSGLAAVHEAGAVHRDLKPSNVMIVGDGVVVFDFGVAHVGDLSQLTISGQFVGTLKYAAPEQASGLATTGASDVYAAGVILYEMLSGRFPHEADSTIALLMKIASEPPVPIVERRSDLPEDVIRIMGRMLAKDPAERPGAAEAREMLSAVIE